MLGEETRGRREGRGGGRSLLSLGKDRLSHRSGFGRGVAATIEAVKARILNRNQFSAHA